MSMSLETERSLGKCRDNYRLIALALIIAVGFAVRLHALDHESLWTDEILTVRYARSGFGGITGDPHHPPLYYALAAVSLNAFEQAEFAARFPSVLTGTLAIAAIAFLGSTIGPPNFGVWAAFILAISPFHIHYSQEGRQYALLLLLSLLSYAFLYKAMRRPRWSGWLAFAFFTGLNLYTHFGALIVLATQGVLIGFWSLSRLLDRRASDLVFPMTALALALALFLPWVPRLLAALEFNIGSETISDTGGVASLGQWLDVAYGAFTTRTSILGPLLVGLCLLGFLYWVLGREWRKLVFVLAGLVLPLFFILLFQVARGAFDRFIIYVLPFFLLPVAYAIERSLYYVRRLLGRSAYRAAAAICLFGLILLVRPAVAGDYEHVNEDWRGILSYIEQNTDGDYIIAGLSLGYPNGFNSVDHSLPFYLEGESAVTPVLEGNQLKIDRVRELNDADKSVWAVVNSWQSLPASIDDSLEIVPFQTDLYVLHELGQAGTTYERLLPLYEAVVDYAGSPSPLCFLKRDLATLHLAASDYSSARQELDEGMRLCPDLKPWPAVEIYTGLLRQYSPSTVNEQAIELAGKILVFDSKNTTALAILSVHDLLDLFERGSVEIALNDAPDPVVKRRFTMPDDGDWGDVLLIHPPAAVSFNLTLPDEPTAFRSRIALAPESWSWGGDGATFVLQIQDQSGAVSELFRQHVGNLPEHQRWHDLFIPLDQYAGQEIVLTLTTENGPAGDGTGDWAGWERPRLVWQPR